MVSLDDLLYSLQEYKDADNEYQAFPQLARLLPSEK